MPTFRFKNYFRKALMQAAFYASVIFSLFIFTNADLEARSFSESCERVSSSTKVIFIDCPELALNIGDPCDDNNTATENDVVNNECSCTGTYPAPANDLIENAQVLPNIDSLACDGNEIIGTTLGANNELGAFECDSLNDSRPDVFYTFNSGDYINVMLYIDLITQTDLIISVSEVGENGDVIFCHEGNAPFLVSKNTNYIIRIAPASGFEGAGDFKICFSPYHQCYDGDPGDPCYTWYNQPGIYNSNCECETPIGNCYADNNGGIVSLPNTREIWTGWNSGSNFYTFTDLIDGEQYSFDCPYYAWVTIRANNQIVHEGGSTTYTSDGTNIRVDFNGNSDCWTSASFNTYVNVQCITCNNCPDLEANFGDACDDGNPYTADDTIDTDCNCMGESQKGNIALSAIWDSNCNERDLSLSLYATGDTTMLYAFTSTIDASGNTYLSDSIAVGEYDIYTKINGYLATGFYNQSISTGNNTLSIDSTTSGDINNDNKLDILDVSSLVVTFGLGQPDSGFNYLADLNCDGSVNIVDISILISAFGQVGAQQ